MERTSKFSFYGFDKAISQSVLFQFLDEDYFSNRVLFKQLEWKVLSS